MHRLLMTLAVAGTMAAATVPASAMPSAQPLPLASDSKPDVTLVWGGCGPFRHPGWNGLCYPNRAWGWGRPYGWGWHRPWGWGGGWRWHRWHHWY